MELLAVGDGDGDGAEISAAALERGVDGVLAQSIQFNAAARLVHEGGQGIAAVDVACRSPAVPDPVPSRVGAAVLGELDGGLFSLMESLSRDDGRLRGRTLARSGRESLH